MCAKKIRGSTKKIGGGSAGVYTDMPMEYSSSCIRAEGRGLAGIPVGRRLIAWLQCAKRNVGVIRGI